VACLGSRPVVRAGGPSRYRGGRPNNASAYSSTQDPPVASADQKLSSAEQNQLAQAKYYNARAEDVAKDWKSIYDRVIALLGGLATLGTAWAAIAQWKVATTTAENTRTANEKTLEVTAAAQQVQWETLRDGQYFEILKRLTEDTNPRARAVAAGVLGFMGKHINSIPNELVRKQLERAKQFEQRADGSKDVVSAIDEALQMLKNDK
jgi:hypothetical protein